MANYPSAPNFATPGPDASDPNGWWSYTREDGSLNVCVADGAAVLRRARVALNLSDSPVWDSDLQAALATRAQLFNNAQPGAGWASFVAELQNGLSSQTPTPNAMKFAIWLGYYQPNGLRLDAINLDGNATLPQWGVPVQDGAAGDMMACFDPNRDAEVYTLNQNDLAAAEQASTSGVRLHSGESLPVPSAPLPPPGPSGLPTWALVIIGLGAVALIAAATTSNVKYAEEKRTSVVPPVPSRRSQRRAA